MDNDDIFREWINALSGMQQRTNMNDPVRCLATVMSATKHAEQLFVAAGMNRLVREDPIPELRGAICKYSVSLMSTAVMLVNSVDGIERMEEIMRELTKEAAGIQSPEDISRLANEYRNGDLR